MKRMEQDMRAKKQPEPWKQLNKAHKTHIDWLEARIKRTMASLRAAVALGTSIAAQVDLRNAQIVRLCQAAAACGQASQKVEARMEHQTGQV